MNRKIIDTDNRDMNTTVLTLDNGDTVTVNVSELYNNMIENNPPTHPEDFVVEEPESNKEYTNKCIHCHNVHIIQDDDLHIEYHGWLVEYKCDVCDRVNKILYEKVISKK
jgi:hypothetical protein